MSDYMTLLGSEQVQSAGRAIASAADTISSAMSSFDSSVDRLIRAMEEHASRIENATEGKRQWDQVASLLGADGDNVDAVLKAAAAKGSQA